MPQDRLLIEITERQDFHTLVQKIEESLVMTYDHFKGLRGIRVKEMKKYQTLLQNQKQEIILQNQTKQESIQYDDKNELVVK